jgi:hypothetical protein
MPLNRLRQFEAFTGASYISDYLCLAHGDKVVIRIASSKRPTTPTWPICTPALPMQCPC